MKMLGISALLLAAGIAAAFIEEAPIEGLEPVLGLIRGALGMGMYLIGGLLAIFGKVLDESNSGLITPLAGLLLLGHIGAFAVAVTVAAQ